MEPATEKLYWSDPHATAFEADVVELGEHAGRPAVVLARTLFYPEGGGQLGDTGTLDLAGVSVRVVDTQIDERGRIHHVLEELPSASPRDARGTIDVARRRDHMAQHTAQHALSRALVDEARAETVSSRLGESTCTVDIGRPGVPDAELARAEDLVNALVTSDVPVRTLFPTPEELATLPLRKRPSVSEGVRVVDIEGFDLSPCGGTHCTRTGQIGQVRIVATERYKGMLRVTFHAGRRALADARARHAALAAVAADLTCGALDVPAAVTKLRAEMKATRTQLETARAELASLVAAKLREALPPTTDHPGPIVLPVIRTGDDLAQLRVLAGKLTEDPRVVAIVGAEDASTRELVVVVQRGTGTNFDSGAFVSVQTKARGGRGGGRPERAEGRLKLGTSVEDIAAAAREALQRP